MVLFSMLRLYMMVTTLTAGGFCVAEGPDDGSERCSNTFTVEDAKDLIKQMKTNLREHNKGRVIDIDTSTPGLEGDQSRATPTIELSTSPKGNDWTTFTPTATAIGTAPRMTASKDEVTTSEHYDGDAMNEPGSSTTRDTKPSTTTSEDGVSTSEPEDDRAHNTSYFIFPREDHKYYVKYEGIVPQMTSLTACAWVRPVKEQDPVAGTLFNYCASSNISESNVCKTVHMKIDAETPSIKVYFESRGHSINTSGPITTRTHLCIVKSASSTATYVNGSSVPSDTTQNPNPVPANGVLILGHSQHGSINRTRPGIQRFADEGFHGEIEGFTLWKRALNTSEILEMYESDDCYSPSVAVVIFDRDNSIVPNQGVTYNWTDACNKN